MSDTTMLGSGQETTDTGAQQTTDAQNAAPAADANQAQAPAADAQGAQQPAAEQQGEQNKPAEGAPEAYEFKLPEGYQLNPEVAGEFGKWAKELNLPQDKAQAAADIGVKLVEQAFAQQQEAYAAQVAEWRKQTETDKEIGGPALAENLSFAARAIDTFAPELREVFDQTGMGNHPALVKAFIRIGKAISEDQLVGGARQSAAAEADPAKRLFPNMN